MLFLPWDGFPTCSRSLFQVSMPKIKTATAYDDNVVLEDNIEEVLIKYYFYCGFQYADILDFLITFHNIEISERTLHRGLRTYGLSRRDPDYDVDVITAEIWEMLDGPECTSDYKHVWHSLQLKGQRVP